MSPAEERAGAAACKATAAEAAGSAGCVGAAGSPRGTAEQGSVPLVHGAAANADAAVDAAGNPAVHAFSRLFAVVAALRGAHGCPWDKDQTPLSMRHNIVEEAFEAADAISGGNAAHAREELGDVLFDVLLTAFMYEQDGSFSVADVLSDVTDKLVRRHPHVFGPEPGSRPLEKAAVNARWDDIKNSVEGRACSNVLDQVPLGFPPLLRAYKLLSKAAKLHFDWESAADARAKLCEELAEVDEAADTVAAELAAHPAADGGRGTPFTRSAQNPAADSAQLHLEEEIGDLLMCAVNLSRMHRVDPSLALDRANRKFYRRFSFVERRMQESGLPFDDAHLAEMEAFWQEAKREERKN